MGTGHNDRVRDITTGVEDIITGLGDIRTGVVDIRTWVWDVSTGTRNMIFIEVKGLLVTKVYQ